MSVTLPVIPSPPATSLIVTVIDLPTQGTLDPNPVFTVTFDEGALVYLTDDDIDAITAICTARIGNQGPDGSQHARTWGFNDPNFGESAVTDYPIKETPNAE